MKKLLALLVLGFLSLSSCGEYYYNDLYEDDVTVIVTNGTPYYHDGIIWYYYYNDLYYYRFFYNGHWYLRPYGRLYTWEWYNHYNHHYFRPHHSDYRFKPDRPHGGVRPHHHSTPPRVGSNIGPRGHRPNNSTIRPNNSGHRPGGLGRDNNRPRGSVRPSSGRRH